MTWCEDLCSPRRGCRELVACTRAQPLFLNVALTLPYLTLPTLFPSPAPCTPARRRRQCVSEWAIDNFEDVLLPLDNYIRCCCWGVGGRVGIGGGGGAGAGAVRADAAPHSDCTPRARRCCTANCPAPARPTPHLRRSKSTEVFLTSQQPNYLALTNQVRGGGQGGLWGRPRRCWRPRTRARSHAPAAAAAAAHNLPPSSSPASVTLNPSPRPLRPSLAPCLPFARLPAPGSC